MRKFAIVFIGLFFAVAVAGAQDYNTGIGFRGGITNGLTAKQIPTRNNHHPD